MPTYQYACTACDHRFEAVQSFSDEALTVCPECSGALRKVYSAVGVVFKGSGFYRTDSRANGSKSTSSSSTSAAKDSTAKTESKTESKSESSKPAATASTSSTGSGSAA